MKKLALASLLLMGLSFIGEAQSFFFSTPFVSVGTGSYPGYYGYGYGSYPYSRGYYGYGSGWGWPGSYYGGWYW